MPDSIYYIVQKPMPIVAWASLAYHRAYALSVLYSVCPAPVFAQLVRLRFSTTVMPAPQFSDAWHAIRFAGTDLPILLQLVPVLCPIDLQPVTWFETLPVAHRPRSRSTTRSSSPAAASINPSPTVDFDDSSLSLETSPSPATAQSPVLCPETEDGFVLPKRVSRRSCPARALKSLPVANRFAPLSLDSDTESSPDVDSLEELLSDLASDLRRNLCFRRWLFLNLHRQSHAITALGLLLDNYEFVSAD